MTTVFTFYITSSLWPASIMALIHKSRVQILPLSAVFPEVPTIISKLFLKGQLNCSWFKEDAFVVTETGTLRDWQGPKVILQTLTQRVPCFQPRAHYNILVLLPCSLVTQQLKIYTHLRSHHMVLLRSVNWWQQVMPHICFKMLHCHW